LNRHSTIG